MIFQVTVIWNHLHKICISKIIFLIVKKFVLAKNPHFIVPDSTCQFISMEERN